MLPGLVYEEALFCCNDMQRQQLMPSSENPMPPESSRKISDAALGQLLELSFTLHRICGGAITGAASVQKV